MDENTIADCTPKVKTRQEISLQPLLPDAMYSGQQLRAILRVSHETIREWIRHDGLPAIMPRTRMQFFWGGDVIAAMRRASQAEPKPKRKKGKK